MYGRHMRRFKIVSGGKTVEQINSVRCLGCGISKHGSEREYSEI
jgi:hypothetical protein